MSILPEIVLQTVLVQGIKDARRDDETLDMLFRTSSQRVVENLKDAFKEVKVNVTLNYPRENVQLPCIAILLRGEDETEAVLGDLLGEGYGPGTIDPSAMAGTDARGLADSRIREEYFYTPEETAVVSPSHISQPTQTIIGEPRRMLVNDGETLYKRQGVGDQASYMLHILAGKPEMAIFLYALTKYILRKNRMTLERNGLLEFTISGTDFAPQPTFLPTYTYSRALSCRFLHWFDWYLTQGKDGSLGYGDEDVATGFDITLDSLQHGDDSVDIPVTMMDQLPVISTVEPSSISQSVETTLILSGDNFQNVGSVRFPNMEYDAAGPTGIQILSTEYIHGNDLRVVVIGHSTGTTDVVVINPDLLSTTLTNGLTVV